MSTKLKAGTATSGAVIDADTTGILELQSGSTPTTAVTINTSQNVGIGTATPNFKLDVQIASESALNLYNTTATSNDSVQAQISSFNGTYWNQISHNASSYVWKTYNTERMRFDSNGNFMVGKTSPSATVNGFAVNPNGQGANIPAVNLGSASNSAAYLGYAMYYNNNVNQWQFYVDWNGTISARSTSIASLSDAREKKNIKDLETGLAEVMQLQPKRFDWKDDSKTNLVGFIAQEVQKVLPDLVENYRVEEGQEERFSLRTGDILPTLVKAIQELNAKVDAQAAEIAALKGAK